MVQNKDPIGCSEKVKWWCVSLLNSKWWFGKCSFPCKDCNFWDIIPVQISCMSAFWSPPGSTKMAKYLFFKNTCLIGRYIDSFSQSGFLVSQQLVPRVPRNPAVQVMIDQENRSGEIFDRWWTWIFFFKFTYWKWVFPKMVVPPNHPFS